MRFTSLLKHYETTNLSLLNRNNHNRLFNMKHIPTIIIILMLSYIIGGIIGISGRINKVSNTEPLKQIIFKYDADLDQCEIEKNNYKYTVDSMSKECN